MIQSFFYIIVSLLFLCTPLFAQENVPPGTEGGGNSKILDVLELKDMDINDVFKLISIKTGINIIAGRNVQGRVTIYLSNVEVHDALHIILEANDLAFIESRGIMQILPAADFERMFGYKFSQKMVRKVIALKGMNAADAAAMLGNFKSAAGKIVPNEQSNALIVEELPDNLKSIEKFIRTMDVPVHAGSYDAVFIGADVLAARITEILTPKIGTVRFDMSSNKVFFRDTEQKLKDINGLIQQLDVPRRTKVIYLSYTKAEDMIKTIASMVSKDLGHVEADTKGNQIVLTDIPSKIHEISRVIYELDHKEKQVLIQARIVQVSLTDKMKLGINWDTIVDKWHGLRMTHDFSLGDTVAPKGMGQISIGTFSNDQYNFVMQALNTSAKTRLLSNPSIAVVNNQEAKILVGTTKPYVTTTTTTPASGPTSISEAVTFIDVGVKLTVTPTIHADGYVTMKIKPEVSSATTTITTSSKNEIPVVDTSTVDTTIRVRDGVTIVLGGLIKDERSTTTNQVPWLGKLPLIGAAFRNSNEAFEKTEIMVFLTPRIITGDVVAKTLNPPLNNKDKIYTDHPLD